MALPMPGVSDPMWQAGGLRLVAFCPRRAADQSRHHTSGLEQIFDLFMTFSGKFSV
jgi:hypothetical protein